MLACSSGCATGPSYNAPHSSEIATQSIGARFVGRDVQEMIGRYGLPTRQMVVSGQQMYAWRIDDVMYFSTQAPLNVWGELVAYTSADGTVTNVGVSGKDGACGRFMP